MIDTDILLAAAIILNGLTLIAQGGCFRDMRRRIDRIEFLWKVRK